MNEESLSDVSATGLMSTVDDDNPSVTVRIYEDEPSDCHRQAARQLNLSPISSYVITSACTSINALPQLGDVIETIRAYLGERTDTFISIEEASLAIDKSLIRLDLQPDQYFVGMSHKTDSSIPVTYGLVYLKKCTVVYPYPINQPELESVTEN